MATPDLLTPDLLAFLDASPSPFHAVASVATRLSAAGFVRLDETSRWSASGRFYIERGGSIVAWAVDDPAQLHEGFRIIGAHTDSPNLRVKPRPDTGRAGYEQVAVEVYGGALWNSWLDRDLGLSGRIVVRTETGPVARLLKLDRALLRIPQLAIHLDRGVNDGGLKLNPQQHLVPIWSLGNGVGAAGGNERAMTSLLADELGVAPADVLSWDLMLHDLTPAALLGRHEEFISSARLDNLLSCWAGTAAVTEVLGRTREPDGGTGPGGVPVLCCFDHEEIGSESASGAGGNLLPVVLERIATAAGCDREDFLRTLAASRCVSADGAHATHPNYVERHEPGHLITPNAGPVIKTNTNVRYATDGLSAGWFKLACERAGVPVQDFVARSDMPCGSTIGPMTAARLGIPTVDVGVAQLSMHSARELCGRDDPALFVRALSQFLAD